LIDNILPKTESKLPQSWVPSCNDQTKFCIMDYDHSSDRGVDLYSGVSAFFVMQEVNGVKVKMLRIGLEYGGPGQLIHLNFQNPKWWTDPVYMKTLIAAFNRETVQFFPIAQYGSDTSNWFTAQGGFMIYSDDSANEKFSVLATEARLSKNPDFNKNWADAKDLPEGADEEIFGANINFMDK